MSLSPAWQSAYEADPKGMQDGWRAILGPRPQFPKELLIKIPGPEGKRYNETAHTIQEYYKHVLEHAPRRDLWVGWSGVPDYFEDRMSWSFGDIDAGVDHLQEALDRARRYEEFCKTTFDVQPIALFSCGKGFHLHFTHDDVPYRGRAYADAVQFLADKSRAYLDGGPLTSRQAKPRVPYSINLQATGRERASMFVIPVDLSWSLKEVIQAAKECRVTRFKVPHSRTAAGLIEPYAKKVHERLVSLSKTRKTSGSNQKSIQAALAFCEENGARLVDGRGRPDGRKRLLIQIYVPALLHAHRGQEAAVLEAAKTWTAAVGADWRTYEQAARSAIKYCTRDPKGILHPMGVTRWLSENPGLRLG